MGRVYHTSCVFFCFFCCGGGVVFVVVVVVLLFCFFWENLSYFRLLQLFFFFFWGGGAGSVVRSIWIKHADLPKYVFLNNFNVFSEVNGAKCVIDHLTVASPMLPQCFMVFQWCPTIFFCQ